MSQNSTGLAPTIENRHETILVGRHKLIQFIQYHALVGVDRGTVNHAPTLQQADNAVGVVHPGTSRVAGRVARVLGHCIVLGSGRAANGAGLVARSLSQHGSDISPVAQQLLKIIHDEAVQRARGLGLGEAWEIWHIVVHQRSVHPELRALDGEGGASLRGARCPLRGRRLLGSGCGEGGKGGEVMEVCQVDGGVVLRGGGRGGRGRGLGLVETRHWGGFGLGVQGEGLQELPCLAGSGGGDRGGRLYFGLYREQLAWLDVRRVGGLGLHSNRGHHWVCTGWRQNTTHSLPHFC